ncbi:UNVERIFIED_ORG: TolB-like protein/class 3 adenylate cyclase [Bradyrhizobium japonicum]
MERRLAAVLAADIAGYSLLMGRDEEGTLSQLKAFRKTLIDPTIAAHRGRIVKTTGDGMLVEFASAVDAARCAVEVQRGVAAQNLDVPQDFRLEFRIGIHVGDIIFDDNDIFGDGVNIAARLEWIAKPGGICISDDAQRQIRGKLDSLFEDMGPQNLKNIVEPMRAWRLSIGERSSVLMALDRPAEGRPLKLPDKPSIAVLPFQNLSSDPEQDYFADGIVEDIITALSHYPALFVIARNSSFTYKGHAVDVKKVGRELGVRYVLEGSVRKARDRVRVTGQLIDATNGSLMDRAQALNSNLAMAWHLSGWIRCFLGQPDVAVEHLERAVRLSPVDPQRPGMQAAIAAAHFAAGRFDIASSLAKSAMLEQSNNFIAALVAAAANAMTGNLGIATSAMERVHTLDPNFCLSKVKDRLPHRQPELIARWEDALRRAGLPE